MDAEFCSWQKVAADVSGVVAGETVVVVAAVLDVVAPTDTGLAVVSDN